MKNPKNFGFGGSEKSPGFGFAAHPTTNRLTGDNWGGTPFTPSSNLPKLNVRKQSVYSLNSSDEDEDDITPLHVAAGANSVEAIEMLITEFNFNVNKRTETGETPLHFACCNKR